MNYSALEKNVIEVMEEQQAKLGFDKETVYLFYPVDSVALMLAIPAQEKGLTEALNGFCAHVRSRLGDVSYVLRDGRVSFAVPTQGAEYVRDRLREDSFIVRLVRMLLDYASLDAVIGLFKAYSDKVCIRNMPAHEEFDCLVYFEDGIPDGFYYCLKEEHEHVTYHRFTKADFAAFGFDLTEDQE